MEADISLYHWIKKRCRMLRSQPSSTSTRTKKLDMNIFGEILSLLAGQIQVQTLSASRFYNGQYVVRTVASFRSLSGLNSLTTAGRAWVRARLYIFPQTKVVNWKNALTKWLGLSVHYQRHETQGTKSESEYHDHHHQLTKLLIVPDTCTLLCFLLYDLTKPDYKEAFMEALSQITQNITSDTTLRAPKVKVSITIITSQHLFLIQAGACTLVFFSSLWSDETWL